MEFFNRPEFKRRFDKKYTGGKNIGTWNLLAHEDV